MCTIEEVLYSCNHVGTGTGKTIICEANKANPTNEGRGNRCIRTVLGSTSPKSCLGCEPRLSTEPATVMYDDGYVPAPRVIKKGREYPITVHLYRG